MSTEKIKITKERAISLINDEDDEFILEDESEWVDEGKYSSGYYILRKKDEPEGFYLLNVALWGGEPDFDTWLLPVMQIEVVQKRWVART